MADSLQDAALKYFTGRNDGTYNTAVQTPSLTGFGDVTAPGAGAAVATISNVPAGTWDVTICTNLAGSAAAGDRPNLTFKVGGSSVATILSTMNGYNDTIVIRVSFTSATTITVNAIGAGTAGAVYRCSMIVTRFI